VEKDKEIIVRAKIKMDGDESDKRKVFYGHSGYQNHYSTIEG
jgi:hypothetical protein